MSTPDRSRVIRLTEAQARIPGPAGERVILRTDRPPPAAPQCTWLMSSFIEN